jgi:hypothetical protein
MLAKWDEFTREPIGPRGQKWPAKLLPIEGDDWDVTCIDRESGKLIFWDVEELDYGGWKKSFRDEAESLEAWFDQWLGKPSQADKAKAVAERPAPSFLTDEDWDEWGKDDPHHADYLKRLEVATMTAEERAAAGYSEDNWHEEMFAGFDLMGITLPTPGYADRKRAKGGAS